MILTVAAALAIAAQCVPPSTAPLIVGIAQHESSLQPLAIHDNISGRSYSPDTVQQAIVIARSLIAIGHASLDLGIAQVNTANFGWTGLTIGTAFDACHSFAAGSAVLLAKYNGNPPDTVKAVYAGSVTANVRAIDDVAADPKPQAEPLARTPFTRPARTGREIVFTTANKGN